MPKQVRVANARAAAQSYAPPPNGSTITYGLIGAALMLVATIIAGSYYRIDVISNPLPLAVATLVTFMAGVMVRVWRHREHERAFAAEYTKRIATPPPPPNPTAGMSQPVAAGTAGAGTSSNTVTFRLPFLLPGLDRPHPAGTFELRERHEMLDVSFDASVVTRTLMLTGNGSTEALDVTADDLAEALRLDTAAPH